MRALTKVEGRMLPAAGLEDQPAGFDFSELRVFVTIPNHRDFDVVPMHGLVIVFDRSLIAREGISPGKLYVREDQHPAGGGTIESFYQRELLDEEVARRCQPRVPLVTRREVVQAIEHRHGPAFRLASGFVDGPYKEYCYGWNLVGKVVGIYRPSAAA